MVTPLGNSAAETWQGIIAGRSGVGPLTRCTLEGFPPEVAIAGEVKGFSTDGVLDRRDARRMDTFIHYALLAADEALRDAGLGGLQGVPEPDETGVIVGSGIGGLNMIMDSAATLASKGIGRISPFLVPGSVINLAGGQIAMRIGATGPNYAPVSACSTGNHAIGEAFHAIQRGDARMMITGGSEACLTPMSFAGYHAARARHRVRLAGNGLPAVRQTAQRLRSRRGRGNTGSRGCRRRPGARCTDSC